MARKRSVAGIRFGFDVLGLSSRWRACHCLINHTFFLVPEVRIVAIHKADRHSYIAITGQSLNTERELTGNIWITEACPIQ